MNCRLVDFMTDNQLLTAALLFLVLRFVEHVIKLFLDFIAEFHATRLEAKRHG